MLKADLHVHTRYSANPADRLLKKFGTQESYTELEDVYRSAKARGMDFVTVTDHNVIDGALKLVEMYPDEAFTGVELTSSFPEDECAVHILVYDFTPAQFEELNKLRSNIYSLRDYIRRQNLPYSVAHATYSVNGRLTVTHIEKLILLFDVFECVNGTRAKTFNDLLKQVLRSLTPQKIDELRRHYLIEPFSQTPWAKAYTGGSDEHAGLFIGETFTCAEGATKADFLSALRDRRTDSAGRSNHYKTQVFSFLKIAWESTQANPRKSSAIWSELGQIIFEGRAPGWKLKLKLEQMKRSRKEKDRAVARQVAGLLSYLAGDQPIPVSERIDAIYNTMAAIEDSFFLMNAEAFKEAFGKRDVIKIMSALTALFRSFFLSVPFLGTFRHLYQSSEVMREFRGRFLGPLKPGEQKILWFTDTLNDLNGVSVTLRNFAEQSEGRGLTAKVVSVRQEHSAASYQVELPMLYEYTPEFYPTYTLRFPSLLKSLEIIYAECPTQIVVSTPGPVGLIGLLAARLFGIPCVGIYHSDFMRMTELGLSGGTLASFVQGYVKWFYSNTDEIRVPSEESRRQMVVKGFDESKLRSFRRGIDTRLFAPLKEDRSSLRLRYGIDGAFTLLYVGRVSKDKSVDFLVNIYRELRKKGETVNLIICGDGPELDRLKAEFGDDPRVKLTGRVAREDLPVVYSLADLFIFPSTMDTFGMAVLEAQSCGLPALVTNFGGPQEVIEPDITGFVLPANNLDAWVDATLNVYDLAVREPRRLAAMKEAARTRVRERFAWDDAIEELFGEK